MKNDTSRNIPLALIIAGAVLGILSLFSLWLSDSVDYAPIKSLVTGITGAGMIDSVVKDKIGWVAFVPIMITILSIVAAVVALLPEFGVKTDKRIITGVVAVIGLVIVILFIMYFIKDGDTGKLGDHLGLGAWLGLLTGIIAIVVGGFGLYKEVNQ